MPSVSKKQQKFMGIVRSIQKGEQPAGKFSKDAQDAAKKMKKSSVKKYAKTKHDDLPVKKESTAAYKKSLEKIAKDKQLKMISKKDKEPFYKGVNFSKFTNKDGYAKGGVEYTVSEKIPLEDQVGGQRRMLKDKKSKVKWY